MQTATLSSPLFLVNEWISERERLLNVYVFFCFTTQTRCFRTTWSWNNTTDKNDQGKEKTVEMYLLVQIVSRLVQEYHSEVVAIVDDRSTVFFREFKYRDLFTLPSLEDIRTASWQHDWVFDRQADRQPTMVNGCQFFHLSPARSPRWRTASIDACCIRIVFHRVRCIDVIRVPASWEAKCFDTRLSHRAIVLCSNKKTHFDRVLPWLISVWSRMTIGWRMLAFALGSHCWRNAHVGYEVELAVPLFIQTIETCSFSMTDRQAWLSLFVRLACRARGQFDR